jgi:hypothetical protein
MPMIPALLKMQIKNAVLDSLKSSLSKVGGKDNSSAEADWAKIADAISEMAGPIIDTVKQAETASDIPVAGVTLSAPPVPVTGSIPTGTKLNIL